MSFSHWMQIVAGTGVFLFAMLLMEDALKQLAGRSFKVFLQKQTTGKVKGILGGTLVTALLQSSSIASVMVLSFVGAGIITMRNALPVLLGANLGTTLNNWVVALLGFRIDLEAFAYPLIGVAFLGFVIFPSHKKINHFCRFLMGFSLIFIGLDFMKQASVAFVDSFDVSVLRDYGVIIFVVAGFLITAVIQSSAATVALTMASLNTGILLFPQAAGIVIGSELGTTLKLVLGSMGSTSDKKRLAYGNFIFNAMTIVIAVSLLKPLIYFIHEILKPSDEMVALVMFQTSINLLGIILIFPFINMFSTMLERRFTHHLSTGVTYLSKQIQFPDDFITALREELKHFLIETFVYKHQVFGNKKRPIRQRSNILQQGKKEFTSELLYNEIKLLQGDIIQHISKFSVADFSPAETQRKEQLTNGQRLSMQSVKEIKDITHNLEEMSESANDFVFSMYNSICQEQNEWMERIEAVLDVQPAGIEDFFTFLEENKNTYKNYVDKVFEAARTGAILDMETATLLNVFREIYSSNKHMIESLAILHDLPVE